RVDEEGPGGDESEEVRRRGQGLRRGAEAQAGRLRGGQGQEGGGRGGEEAVSAPAVIVPGPLRARRTHETTCSRRRPSWPPPRRASCSPGGGRPSPRGRARRSPRTGSASPPASR